ncbi:hypothetical protein NQ315_015544 [Exocentrus adspersus]|uniref:Uncharacterized protein n=1 Tax=Exocentrus adspersus TaxID=1586481 RepID=A0AAV8VAH9_9CUCU|nr:hypothetical protein NQ315_015544 [Exocentrus adspersus]
MTNSTISKQQLEKEEFVTTTCLPYLCLPYMKRCMNRIGRLLKKLNINTVFTTMNKIALEFPKTTSNVENLQSPGEAIAFHTSGKVYTCQTGGHITTRLQGIQENNNFEKTVVTKHRANTEYSAVTTYGLLHLHLSMLQRAVKNVESGCLGKL